MPTRFRIALLVLVLGLVVAVPASAGSAVVGSVAGSLNATIGGQPLLPHTTIFSGDNLQVKDGAAVVAIGSGNQMVFGRETAASFLRESDEVTVQLGRGNVSIFYASDSTLFRVKVGYLTVVPAKGFKTLGEVAMVNGIVVVTTKEGALRVEAGGSAVVVTKGKVFTIPAKPARASGAGGAAQISLGTMLQVSSLGLSVASTSLSAVAAARASDAAELSAQTTQIAEAVTQAATQAQAAAQSAQSTAVASGCALNKVASKLGVASPFTPPRAPPGLASQRRVRSIVNGRRSGPGRGAARFVFLGHPFELKGSLSFLCAWSRPSQANLAARIHGLGKADRIGSGNPSKFPL